MSADGDAVDAAVDAGGPQGSVLLVDDDVDILRVLRVALEQVGYRVTAVETVEAARTAAADADFDAVLLDLGLPDGDGIELATELKAGAGPDVFLPVVLVTGRQEIETRVRGFKAGCDEFLTKPINLFELRARIDVLLTRRMEHAALAAANKELQRLHQRKKTLASLVVHDLRNPLSALQGNVELLIEELEPRESPDSGEQNCAAVGSDSLVAEILSDCRELAAKSLTLVAGLLDVEELEEGLLEARRIETDVEAMCRHAARHHGATIRLRELLLSFRCPDGLRAHVDADLLGRLVENLLDNAMRYAPRAGNVLVWCDTEGDELVIRVGNDGPPVPQSERAKVFGRYYRIEARRSGARANRGLGLYFCKLVAEAHGGSIALVGHEGMPACFEVRLPGAVTSPQG